MLKRKNEILNLLREGLTIGKIAEKLKIDWKIVSSVIFLNIKNVPILRGESL